MVLEISIPNSDLGLDSEFKFGACYYYGWFLWLLLFLLTTFVKAGVRISITNLPLLLLLLLLLVLGQ